MSSLSSKKGVWALAVIAASYLLAYRLSKYEGPISTAVAIVGLSVLLLMPLVAIVLAVLDMREVRAIRKGQDALRRQGPGPTTWQAILALALAVPFLGSFAYSLASRFFRSAPETHASSPAPSSSGGWVEFTSPAGDFTVLFPEPPRDSTETLERPGGPVKVRSFVAAPGPGVGCSVMTATASVPADETPTATLDRLEAEFVSRSGGKLVGRSDVTTGTVPGRELHVEAAERRLRVRLFATQGRVYQVLSVRPTSSPGDEGETRFLESFHLVDPAP